MNTSNSKPEIKMILLGESGVGKTNLINITLGHSFNENESPTFSNSFLEKKFQINNKVYKLQIWDTIGQEKYRHLTKLFFKNSKIVILVYDKSDKRSFKGMQYWADEVKKELGDDMVMGLVGNKDDKDESEYDVTEDEAREYAKNLNIKFKMVSAKINGKRFVNFVKELLIDYINKNGGNISINDDKIVLDKSGKKKKKNGFKC